MGCFFLLYQLKILIQTNKIINRVLKYLLSLAISNESNFTMEKEPHNFWTKSGHFGQFDTVVIR